MSVKILVRKHRPVDVTLARHLPQFAASFDALTAISTELPVPAEQFVSSQEIVDGVEITVEESTFGTLEDAIEANDATLAWSHADVIAYNQENNVLTFSKIINVETEEVVRDWTQRW
jgi:hypothetical protein